jgi:hypothetical protein
MMIRHFCSVLFLLLVVCAAPAALAQEVFEDPEGQYTLSLPAGWLGIVGQDSLGRKEVNIVFKVRENGSLKIRRVDDVDPNLDVMEFAKKDEESTLRFMPAYNKVGIEKFLITAGKTGALVAYDYKTGGQPFTGREYYLRLNEKTIYVLRFRGRQNILSTLRSHTDSIARSFKLKQANANQAEKK